MKRRIDAALLRWLLALSLLCALVAVRADAARALLTDGRTVSGVVTAADEDSITIGRRRLTLGQLVSVDWGVKANAEAFEERVIFRNGDRVSGKIGTAGTAVKQVRQDTGHGPFVWHAPAVSKLVFDWSESTQKRAAENVAVGAYPMQGEGAPGDRLLVNATTVRVTSQVFGRKEFARGRLAFVALTAGLRTIFPHRKPYVRVLTQNGDVLSGTMDTLADGVLHLKLHFYTFPAATVRLPLRTVSRLIVLNGAATYLSDLAPYRERNVPYLFRCTEPARVDSTFSGGPIELGRTVFSKGLCTRARTELTYRVDRTYRAFQATVGVDAGGPAAPVRFLVYAEQVKGKPLFDSGDVPSPKARAVKVQVGVANVSRLVLVTDFGAKGDAGAWGVWAGARLIRK